VSLEDGAILLPHPRRSPMQLAQGAPLMSFYAPDAVCDMSPMGLGVYQNPRAIRERGLP
jgi:hypothetical protein